MKTLVDNVTENQNSASFGASSNLSIQMREHHHRLRNSLHLIACNLMLKSRQTSNREVKNAFASVARQIDSVGRIHEYLYENSQASDRLARKYLAALLIDLHAALLGSFSTRTLYLKPGDEFELESVALVTIGAIVVELVTNAIKYTRGNVQIALACRADRVEICVEDEGTGFPPGFDLRDAGFGFRLVHHFCSESGGALVVNTDVGHGSVMAVLSIYPLQTADCRT